MKVTALQKSIAKKLFANKEIDTQTYNFLMNNKKTKHGYMYFLPKIHKIDSTLVKKILKDGVCQDILDFPYRPIVNKCNSPTRRIEKFLDLLLKPLLRKESFYIQDTKDFINRIESCKLESDCKLIAYDVTSMYTNMQINDLQETMSKKLSTIDQGSYKVKVPNTTDLIKFVKLVLENNEFEFDGQLYKQVIGAPMGGILSPTCTDLHLASILKIILDKFQHKKNIRLHCQYRDDGFIAFTGNNNQIEEFFSIANAINPLLKFTYETSNYLMKYLDTEVYKGTRFLDSGFLDIKSHIKTTETYQYLPPLSSHPAHTCINITMGETIRHIRNNSSEIELHKQLCNLENKLTDRGYKKNKTKNIIHDTRNKINRLQTLAVKPVSKNIPLTLTTRFNPAVKGLGRALRKHWNKLQSDEVCQSIFKQVPIIAYKRTKNLKEYFAESRY